MSILVELWAFLRTHKKYWLRPNITLPGVFMILAQSSAVASSIYTLF
jgi:hypothetical protein